MAIIGNLSGDERHFVALREAGVMQRLVQLLEQGPESRIPEIAARTLAILAGNDANQTAIRLAGMITVHCTLRLSGCRIWHSSASDFMQTVPSTHEESLAVVLSASLLCLRRHSSPYAAAYRPTQ